MCSNIQTKISFLDDRNREDFFYPDFPFSIEKNLNILCESYNLSILKIDLLYNEEIDWIGIFFYKRIKGDLFVFSGGRFGFSGFLPMNKIKSICDYLPELEAKFKKLGSKTVSLSSSFLEIEPENNTSWISSQVTYLVANTQECVDNVGLSFRKAKIRSNLSRSLKKAKGHGFSVEYSESLDDLKKWYEFCHLQRIKELEGKKWDYPILEGLIKKGTGGLVLVKDIENNILGGSVILFSEKVLEIFMMSTPRENQKLGVNFLIAERIYLLAGNKKIDFINWQASNPPDGHLAKFKKDWNSHEKNFVIYNLNFTNDLRMGFLESNFVDCYVFPFSELEKGKLVS